MPRSNIKATPHLEIETDPGRHSWTAGDVITGRVSRCAPLVSASITISIRLMGRAKSKMTVNRGQSSSVYRNRFNFFTPEQTTVELVTGPIHIPETGDMHSWPFAVTVPDQLNPASVAQGNQQKHSYLPLGHSEILAQPMPPTFYCRGTWFSTTYEAYNEYFLEAIMTVESSGKSETAILPVSILPQSTTGPITDFSLSRSVPLCQLNSHRLVPGAENSSLTLHQRTQHLFRSSKVPAFGFSLHIEYPQILQIGNPAHIPFRLLAIPEREHTTDVLQDCQLELAIESIQLEIKAETEVLCRGTLSSHDARGNRKTRLVTDAALSQLGSTLVVPLGPKAEAIDVGSKLGLSLENMGLDLRSESSSELNRFLYPSFSTYNIQHRHKLHWKIEVSSAGATTKVSDEVDITLLPLLPRSDAPPYTPYQGASIPAYEEETIPSYAEAAPSSSKTDGFIPEKSKHEK
ncbi:hypothetical protein LIA77_06164 [Sarocladium implicatum]|nr:hypothetical protein LIA77_06164 [Sarocladium implicatum]